MATDAEGTSNETTKAPRETWPTRAKAHDGWQNERTIAWWTASCNVQSGGETLTWQASCTQTISETYWSQGLCWYGHGSPLNGCQGHCATGLHAATTLDGLWRAA